MKIINSIINKCIDKISCKLYQNMYPIISEALERNHISPPPPMIGHQDQHAHILAMIDA